MDFNKIRSVQEKEKTVMHSSSKQWKYALVSLLLTFALIVIYRHVQQV